VPPQEYLDEWEDMGFKWDPVNPNGRPHRYYLDWLDSVTAKPRERDYTGSNQQGYDYVRNSQLLQKLIHEISNGKFWLDPDDPLADLVNDILDGAMEGSKKLGALAAFIGGWYLLEDILPKEYPKILHVTFDLLVSVLAVIQGLSSYSKGMDKGLKSFVGGGALVIIKFAKKLKFW